MRAVMTWLKWIVARAALIVGGVAIGLVSLELILWLAVPMLRPALRASGPSAVTKATTIRVLCAGDSHTYGLWVPPEDSYPARLRRRLARVSDRFVVLNAGVPGMNSSQLRDLFPDMLDSFAPDIVVVMVGVADYWNLTALRPEDVRGWRWLLWKAGFWDWSRVVKLGRLLWFNLRYGRTRVAGSPVIEQTTYNWKIRGGERDLDVNIDAHFGDPIRDAGLIRRILHRNLSEMQHAAEARGIRVVLMTYATDLALYGTVNELYREFARQAGLPLIDLGRDLRAWSLPPALGVAFFPDYHPRRAGYELMARTVSTALTGALDQSAGQGRAPD